MFDQRFSAKCFQEIFDNDNRKGNNLENRFTNRFEESIAKRLKLQELSKSIKKEKDKKKRQLLLDEKKQQKKERENLINEILEEVAINIFKNRSYISLIHGGIYGKQSYKLKNTLENYFVSKKIQQNISEIYKIKQASRYAILSQLINHLENEFPKILIRTDIKSFYESISQKKLIEKIEQDNLLSLKTQQYIKLILSSYNNITNQSIFGQEKGVPRGIGISAYLSELYMRKIDNKIREINDLIFYARYVDDIIAIFAPKQIKGIDASSYKEAIKTIIDKNELELNTEKTQIYNLTSGLRNIEISNRASKHIRFLGYKIGSIKKDGKYLLSIDMSDEKYEKYKSKISKAYNEFNNKKKYNRKRAFNLLLARLEYLTSNTRLKNNKSNIFTGIYYTNPFLNSYKSLEKLQSLHTEFISKNDFKIKESELLEKCNFIYGFKDKKFCNLPLVKKKYNNHNSKERGGENKGILQFGINEINTIWK